ncbi:type II toxin-antitoxin system death-on-curing family toxin [Shouchella clausii]|uniref:type II toxin-antitoxin system death-on-curing family toxin n=1 Tax=Shouchella clausii TaxID=79880 RepID=UPI000BA5FE3E|nr:type II toxin-antitoxin system death-on-curing family toxin [Shouchella clausii]PAD92340.1 type II toxin-antitoxin system death-on-curing family toxin [Shouchella clausii]
MVKYLHHQELILINAMLIKRYSPEEQIGIKDAALLDSAINRPKQSAFGEEAYPTIWLKGAALYSSIAQNHAFHNANKRTAFAAMKQFLWVNGYQFMAPQKEAEEFTVKLVTTKPPMEIQEVAEWIEQYTDKRKRG